MSCMNKLCLQVERQIDQMVSFIKQEAEEKANEISVSAEEVPLYSLQFFDTRANLSMPGDLSRAGKRTIFLGSQPTLRTI